MNHLAWLVTAATFLAFTSSGRTEPPTSQPSTQPSLSSKAVEQDGLSVTITLAKARFKPNEPLAFKVSYRNVSKEAMRLPGHPGGYNYWSVKLEDADTGDVYTGRTTLPMGAIGLATPTLPIAPNQALEASIELKRYGFAKGERNLGVNVSRQLPAGRFKLSITISFPEELDPADPLFGDKSIWKGNLIVTSPVEIEVIGSPAGASTTKPATE